MGRNANSHVALIPTPRLPRTAHDFGLHERKITFKHGHLVPFYSRFMYPDQTIKKDYSFSAQLDTSLKLPLDNIYFDTYYFLIPVRLLDPNFAKVLGDKGPYDTNQYSFPKLYMDYKQATNAPALSHDSLPFYLGYSCDVDNLFSEIGGGGASGYFTLNDPTNPDWINPYSMMAYYKVWNEYFRDENLDPEIPYENLLTAGYMSTANANTGNVFGDFNVLPVNRFHDIFSSGLTSAIKGGNATIPMGNALVPVLPGATDHTTGAFANSMKIRNTSNGSYSSSTIALGTNTSGNTVPLSGTGGSYSGGAFYPANLYADMSKATGASIQSLYIAMAINSLYEKKGNFGTRLIELIRGQFGLTVPDAFLDRSQYLGGNQTVLNNTPVMNQTNTDTGTFSGNSYTVGVSTHIETTVLEWSILLGVCCARVKHSYNQGISEPSLKFENDLDMYWPSFANIGNMPNKNYRIFNDFTDPLNTETFNFNQAHIDLRDDLDICAGDFGPLHRSGFTDLYQYWSYQDIYVSRPVFSAAWLKEPVANVARTLTGRLIQGATDLGNASTDVPGHQYMVRFVDHTVLVQPLPARSQMPNITGRL